MFWGRPSKPRPYLICAVIKDPVALFIRADVCCGVFDQKSLSPALMCYMLAGCSPPSQRWLRFSGTIYTVYDFYLSTHIGFHMAPIIMVSEHIPQILKYVCTHKDIFLFLFLPVSRDWTLFIDFNVLFLWKGKVVDFALCLEAAEVQVTWISSKSPLQILVLVAEKAPFCPHEPHSCGRLFWWCAVVMPGQNQPSIG